jgi:hypothetical protein
MSDQGLPEDFFKSNRTRKDELAMHAAIIDQLGPIVRLPTKPSALLKLALKDLELCEEDPRYRVEMGAIYHHPGQDKTSVCLVGCVLAKSCCVPLRDVAGPWYLGDDGWVKFNFIDHVSTGLYYSGLYPARASRLEEPAEDFTFPSMVRYRDNKNHYKSRIAQIAQEYAIRGA